MTVNGHQNSANYGQSSTPTSIASSLAGAINSDSGAFETATANTGTVSLTSKSGGTAANYSLSAGSTNGDTYDFTSASFTGTPSGSTLTGGATGGANAYSVTLTYANNGDVATATDSVNGNWTYTYDDFNRISTAVSNTGFGCAWNFDQFGNRWNQSASGGSCTAAALSFTGVKGGNRADQFTYDAAGDVTNDTTHCYTFDAEGRISAVYQLNCSTLIASYVYDAEGRRVQKTTGGTSVDYLYDIAGHQIAEISSSGAWNRGEIYAGARHLGTYNNGTTFFNHEDWLGTERARSNVTGVVCETITSLPYGDGQNTAGTCGDESPMHFTGKMRDTESNLDDFDARYYSSQWGRFTIPDWDLKPVAIPYANFGDPQSLNLYGYVSNNPALAADADGHGWLKDFWKGIANSTYRPISQMVRHPIVTAKAIGFSVEHPIQTLKGIKTNVTVTATGVIHGNGTAIGVTVGTVAMAFIPGAGEAGDAAEATEATAEAAEAAEAAGEVAEGADAGAAATESAEAAGDSSAQMKKLSSGEIQKLQENGIDPHDLKPNSKYDLFKDKGGNIYVKPKGGQGPGDPTGLNIKDYHK